MTPQPHTEGSARHIGRLLVDANLITQSQLDDGLAVQKNHGGKLVEVLVSLGYISPQAFTRFLARQGMPAIDLSKYELPRDVTSLLPRELARRHEVFPIDRLGKHLTVAMACPLDKCAIAELEEFTGMRIRPVLCSAIDINRAINRYYSEGHDHVDSDPNASFRKLGLLTTHAQEPDGPEAAGKAATAGLETPLRLGSVAVLMRQLESLPTLPDTIQKIQQAASDPGKGVGDVAAIISQDPPLAAKLLSTVNSPAYGFGRNVSSIPLAVSLLGLRDTYALAFSLSVVQALGGVSERAFQLFWRRAVRCGQLARSIAQMRKQENQPAVFAAGLLHDIGQLALLHIVRDPYQTIMLNHAGRELLEVEYRTFGMTHAEAGFVLAEHWGLPEDIAQVIRLHHRPDMAQSHRDLVATIGVADTIASIDRVVAAECRSSLEVLSAGSDLVVEIMRAALKPGGNAETA